MNPNDPRPLVRTANGEWLAELVIPSEWEDRFVLALANTVAIIPGTAIRLGVSNGRRRAGRSRRYYLHGVQTPCPTFTAATPHQAVAKANDWLASHKAIP